MLRRFDVFVCGGDRCAGAGAADAVYDELCRLVADRGLGDRVRLARQICFGRCAIGPNVHVREQLPAVDESVATAPGDRAPRRRCSGFYSHVRPEDAADIVEVHLIGGVRLQRLIYRPDPPAESH